MMFVGGLLPEDGRLRFCSFPVCLMVAPRKFHKYAYAIFSKLLKYKR